MLQPLIPPTFGKVLSEVALCSSSVVFLGLGYISSLFLLYHFCLSICISIDIVHLSPPLGDEISRGKLNAIQLCCEDTRQKVRREGSCHSNIPEWLLLAKKSGPVLCASKMNLVGLSAWVFPTPWAFLTASGLLTRNNLHWGNSFKMPYSSRAGSKPSHAKLNTTCRRAWPYSGSHIDSYLWPMLTTGDPSGHFPADWVQLKL